MKYLSLLFFVLVVLLSFKPVYAETVKPTLKIISPVSETKLITTKVPIEFSLTNFNLTTKPTDASSSGVISIFVDNAFFSNTATTSAALTLAQGTHFVEAELTNANRTPALPRVSDAIFIDVVKKTPYLGFSHIRANDVIYTDQPTFRVDFKGAVPEDDTAFYKVFVDGKEDGSSQNMADISQYTVQNALSVGKHVLRLQLFRSTGIAYSPPISAKMNVIYQDKRPDFSRVDLAKQLSSTILVPYIASVNDFILSKDGHVMISVGDEMTVTDSPSGKIPVIPKGMTKVSFSLISPSGFSIIPEVTVEKVVKIENSVSGTPIPHANGIFMTGEEGNRPKLLFILLAGAEVLVIIAFGVLLFTKEKK